MQKQEQKEKSPRRPRRSRQEMKVSANEETYEAAKMKLKEVNKLLNIEKLWTCVFRTRDIDAATNKLSNYSGRCACMMENPKALDFSQTLLRAAEDVQENKALVDKLRNAPQDLIEHMTEDQLERLSKIPGKIASNIATTVATTLSSKNDKSFFSSILRFCRQDPKGEGLTLQRVMANASLDEESLATLQSQLLMIVVERLFKLPLSDFTQYIKDAGEFMPKTLYDFEAPANVAGGWDGWMLPAWPDISACKHFSDLIILKRNMDRGDMHNAAKDRRLARRMMQNKNMLSVRMRTICLRPQKQHCVGRIAWEFITTLSACDKGKDEVVKLLKKVSKFMTKHLPIPAGFEAAYAHVATWINEDEPGTMGKEDDPSAFVRAVGSALAAGISSDDPLFLESWEAVNAMKDRLVQIIEEGLKFKENMEACFLAFWSTATPPNPLDAEAGGDDDAMEGKKNLVRFIACAFHLWAEAEKALCPDTWDGNGLAQEAKMQMSVTTALMDADEEEERLKSLTNISSDRYVTGILPVLESLKNAYISWKKLSAEANGAPFRPLTTTGSESLDSIVKSLRGKSLDERITNFVNRNLSGSLTLLQKLDECSGCLPPKVAELVERCRIYHEIVKANLAIDKGTPPEMLELTSLAGRVHACKNNFSFNEVSDEDATLAFDRFHKHWDQTVQIFCRRASCSAWPELERKYAAIIQAATDWQFDTCPWISEAKNDEAKCAEIAKDFKDLDSMVIHRQQNHNLTMTLLDAIKFNPELHGKINEVLQSLKAFEHVRAAKILACNVLVEVVTTTPQCQKAKKIQYCMNSYVVKKLKLRATDLPKALQSRMGTEEHYDEEEQKSTSASKRRKLAATLA